MMMTFGMVFLAELGDKTQLATFCLSADCDPKLAVFIGSAAALVLSSLIAVFFWSRIQQIHSGYLYQIWCGAFFPGSGRMDPRFSGAGLKIQSGYKASFNGFKFF